MSFENLVHKISPKLKGITHRLNGHFTFFNEDDLYQEAMVHLWTDFQQGKLADKTDSYVLQGCYFYLKNYIRKTQDKASLVRLYTLNEDGEEADLEQWISLRTPQSDFEELRDRIFLEDIQDENWAAREKEILALSLDGFTTREIGQRLGISHVMVIKLKNKIKEKCQKYRCFL